VQLPIIEQGRRRLVCVGAGEIFLLPPGIPHSPQRSADSFGIVVERERRPGASHCASSCPRGTAHAAPGRFQPVPTHRSASHRRPPLAHSRHRRARRAPVVHGL
jgi:hypothetical protein